MRAELASSHRNGEKTAELTNKYGDEYDVQIEGEAVTNVGNGEYSGGR